MKKSVHILGNEGKEYDIELNATAATFLHYKNHFGGDGFKDMKKLVEEKDGDFEINSTIFYGLLWSLAYSANKKIKPLEQWVEQFDIAPSEFIGQLLEPVSSLLTTNAEVKEKEKN